MLPHHRGSVARRRVPSSESRTCLAMLRRAFAHLHVALGARRQHRRSGLARPRTPSWPRAHRLPRNVAGPEGPRPAQHRVMRTSRMRGRSTSEPTSRRARSEPRTRRPVRWTHRRAAGFKALLHRRVWSRPSAVRRSADLRPSMGLIPLGVLRAREARHGRSRELRYTLAGAIPPRFAADCRSSRPRPSGRTVRPSRVAAQRGAAGVFPGPRLRLREWRTTRKCATPWGF